MFKRFAFYWASVLVGLGFPILLISLRYDLFIQGNIPLKITGTGMISMFIIVYFFKDQMQEVMQNMPDSKLRSFLTASKTPLALFLVCIVVLFAKAQIEHILFILGWSTFANVAAVPLKYIHSEIKRNPVSKKDVDANKQEKVVYTYDKDMIKAILEENKKLELAEKEGK